jgi:hypothetical protein
MASRAVLFAIEAEVEQRLLGASGDAAVMEVIAAVEETWDKEWLCQLDKAWDAIHRSLTDGKLEWDNGMYPLNHAIIGGRQMYAGEDYVVAYVQPDQVKDVAKALGLVNEAALKRGYDAIDPSDYHYAGWEDDFEYMLGWYQYLPGFYQKAASAERAAIFTVDP